MAAGRQQQQRRVETEEEEPPLQPRRSQNLKVSLAEISDAPAVRIPPFPARGEASIGERPCAKPASHPIEAAGAARRRRKSGGGQEEEGAAAEARGYPPPPSSTTINTFAHQHTHPLLKGSLGVAVGAGLRFLPGKWDCLFPNKSEIFGTEGAATQHEQDKNKSGGVAPKGATLPPVSGREGWTGEREKKLPTSGQQEVTSCSDSDKNQAALDERGC